MQDLTFGEQVKIILSRKGMTIKELAEQIEKHTGRRMSRQNLTQRLGRDNFQERDMRAIAEILGCPFRLSILETDDPAEKTEQAEEAEPAENETQDLAKKQSEKEEKEEPEAAKENTAKAVFDGYAATESKEREITIGDLIDIEERAEQLEEVRHEILSGREAPAKDIRIAAPDTSARDVPKVHAVSKAAEAAGETKRPEPVGDINPYTRKEYETNSVRMHPKRIGYVQVYDRREHKWTDMTEWAFLGYQERKKRLLGRDYVPPIYLD